MKESLRRIILFIVIVTIGSITILFDVPLIILIPLIIAVGFIITLLIGALTIPEITTVFKRKKALDVKNVPDVKKVSFFQRLKKTKPVQSTETQTGVKTPPPLVKKEPVKSDDAKDRKVSGVHSFFSSLKSLGTVIKARREHKKKVVDIDKKLDSTISQKIPPSAQSGTGTEGKSGVIGNGGGAVSASVDTLKDQDPFLSLSNAEFDTDLLAGLDDQDASSTPPAKSGPAPGAVTDQSVSDSPVSLPSMDIDSAAQDILKGNNIGGSDTLGGVDDLNKPVDSIDMDLGDLDSLNLDDVVLDAGMDDATSETTDGAVTSEEKSKSSQAPPVKVKTDGWISSDAPMDLEGELEQESTQADMIAFAGGTGGEDDLLSSLSSDIKHVKKEKDLSLLRDLKDYRGTAAEIESELSELCRRLKALKNPEK